MAESIGDTPPVLATADDSAPDPGQQAYNPPIQTEPSFQRGDWGGFMAAVESLANSPTATPSKSSFIFEFTEDAAKQNSKILADANYDLETAIRNQNKFTNLSMGSELRPIHQLDRLLGYHPNYPLFRENTINGISYPVNELDEETRIADLEFQLEKGNHKSALVPDAREHVDKAMLSDIELGYGLPITIDCVRKLTHAEVYPVGLQHQKTIDENGNIIPKKRMSHDLSNRKELKRSINQRTIEELLPDVQYGYTLLRFLHLIHHLRKHNPQSHILMNKVDIEKAYRRFHTTPYIASKCIATWSTPEGKEIAVILTRLPFGSSPALAHFSIGSDITCDLANDLLHCQYWDPKILHSPLLESVPETKYLPDSIPFGQAEPTETELNPEQTAGVEGYIDDIATATIDSPEHPKQVERARDCVLMALHLQFRPHGGDKEPIQRPEAASRRKLLGEGGLSETLIMLGWKINSRTLEISLPEDKAKAWSKSIKTICNHRTRYQYNELATLVGRLNHVAFIIPQARHFMNRIRAAEQRALKHRSTFLKTEEIKDLGLWLSFIRSAEQGISINSIVFRRPTSISITDASETGMGGYNPISGKMWRHQFTEEEQTAFTLNTKEFLAAKISQRLALEEDPSPFPCHLNIGDSKVAEAWMYKSNHDIESSPIQNEIAREMAIDLLSHVACNYSQHLAGIENVVADSLSRDHHLTDTQITSLITNCDSPIAPKLPQLINLSSQTTSWIASLAQLTPKKRELQWQPTISTLAAGVSGWNSTNESHQLTPIWTTSHKGNEMSSYVSLWIQSEMENLLPQTSTPSRARLRDRPETMWRRQSSLVVGRTQD